MFRAYVMVKTGMSSICFWKFYGCRDIRVQVKEDKRARTATLHLLLLTRLLLNLSIFIYPRVYLNYVRAYCHVSGFRD
jgi:hypothetical protein